MTERQNPQAVQGDLANLPSGLDAFKQKPNWVLWQWAYTGLDKDGKDKWTKEPKKPNGRNAKSSDPATWSSYEDVVAAYQRGGFAGIGFCLANSGFGAQDVDKCRDPASGVLKPYAEKLMRRANTYT